MKSFTKLSKALPNIQTNIPLAKYTTLKIGGPAEFLYIAKSIDELIKAVKVARKLQIPITILGGGSNVLISDKDINGLVIINRADKVEIVDNNYKDKATKAKIKSRWQPTDEKILNYDDSKYPQILVKIGSGTLLPVAINKLINKGITGLQHFAGIPGTIGGAVYGNIHGGKYFFSEFIKSVTVLDQDDKIKVLPVNKCRFDYDFSRFQESKEIILSVGMILHKGDRNKAQQIVKYWIEKKKIQPKNSPGCAFKNISEELKQKLDYPTIATGYIIDKILNMKGYRVGDAQISEQHANFIVNLGKATAKDYMQVIKDIQKNAKEKIGIDLELEIQILGKI